MQYKKYIIRWSDLDANGHLAHSSYQKITADARLSLFSEKGVNISDMLKEKVGSVIFREEGHYFKELLFAQEVYVSTELIGLSEECEFFEFKHNIYRKDGTHAYTSKIMGSWIDLKLRKLTPPILEVKNILRNLEKPSCFKKLTKRDTRKEGISALDINAFNF